MTTPTRSRGQSAARPRAAGQATPARESAPARSTKAPARGTGTRGRSSAAERAYARRAQRAEELRRSEASEQRQAPVRPAGLRLRWPRSRASFVLLLMSLLAAGVATTLWLSTQAIADSYRLEQVRQETAGLAERAEQLQRDVAGQESASTLAKKAGELGMVPGGDPARIVVAPDGSTRVVGTPKKAASAAPPATQSPAAQPKPAKPSSPPSGQPSAKPSAAQAPPEGDPGTQDEH